MHQTDTVRRLLTDASTLPALLARTHGRAAVLLEQIGDLPLSPPLQVSQARTGGKPRRIHVDVTARQTEVVTLSMAPRLPIRIATRYATQPRTTDPLASPVPSGKGGAASTPRVELVEGGWVCEPCGASLEDEPRSDVVRASFRLHVTSFGHASQQSS